ncbi:MAG: hypothetical protein AABW87_01450 [Nanoarchaeota archaeon]
MKIARNALGTILVLFLILSIYGVYDAVRLEDKVTGGAVTSGGEVRIFFTNVTVVERPRMFDAPPAGVKKVIDFRLEPEFIDIKVPVGKVYAGKFTIINEALDKVRFFVNVEGVDKILSLADTEFVMREKSRYEVQFLVAASKVGVYLGSIVVGAGTKEKRIPVIIEAYRDEPVFDVEFYITEDDKSIYQDDDVTGRVKIYNLVDDRGEVDVDYTIKDLDNKIITQEKEKKTFSKRISYDKTVDLPDSLPVGEYIYIVEAKYKDKADVASDRFKITNRPIVIEQPVEVIMPNKIILAILILIIIFMLWWVRRKHKKE